MKNKKQTFKNKFSIKHLKFTKMKKQLFLILTLAVFAISISTTVYGQLKPRSIDVTCLTVADALHPIPGNPYDYEITVPNPTVGDPWAVGSLNYQWFVTQDGTFFDATNGFSPDAEVEGTWFNVNANTGISLYNVTSPGAGTTPKINITWSSAGYDRTKPIFVGILVVGVTSNCAPHNLKVYKIEPQHAFTLDIDNLTALGVENTPSTYGDNMDVCISEIESAVYNATDNAIDYNFGENALYFQVVAANWYDRWQLSMELSGLIDVTASGTQSATIDWAYISDVRPVDIASIALGDWHNIAPTGSPNGTYTTPVSDLVQIQGGVTSVGRDGQYIIIRVIIDHGTNDEGITDRPITLAVNGVLAHLNSDTPPVWVVGLPLVEGDIHFTAGTNLPAEKCPWFDGFTNDRSIQTLKARPTVTDNTPPVTNDFLPIN